jgi:hypothetical protein
VTELATANFIVPAAFNPVAGGPVEAVRGFWHRLVATRALLIGAFAVSLVAVGALAVAGFGSYRYYGATVKLIGINSGPSIVASSKMRTLLADASASAILAQLSAGSSRELFLQQSAEAMEQVHGNLISAALNITYGQDERAPLFQLLGSLSDYERRVSVAQATNGVAGVARLQEAAHFLQEQVLPHVDELEQVNLRNLRSAYAQHAESAKARSTTLLGFGLALLGVLVLTQLLLVRRFRRMLSIPLLGAAAVISAYLVLILGLTGSIDKDLRLASQVSFEKIHDLAGVKSAAFAARIAQAEFVISNGSRTSTAAFFNANEKAIGDGRPWPLPVPYQIGQVATSGTPSIPALTLARPPALEEGAPGAVRALQAWSRFLELHTQVVTAQSTGQHEAAVASTIGDAPNQAGWAFDQFIAALDNVIYFHQNAFDDAITRAAQSLRHFPWLLAAVLSLVLLLLVLAFRPRLAEFRF